MVMIRYRDRVEDILYEEEYWRGKGSCRYDNAWGEFWINTASHASDSSTVIGWGV
jgi:hypothetical protein